MKGDEVAAKVVTGVDPCEDFGGVVDNKLVVVALEDGLPETVVRAAVDWRRAVVIKLVRGVVAVIAVIYIVVDGVVERFCVVVGTAVVVEIVVGSGDAVEMAVVSCGVVV